MNYSSTGIDQQTVCDSYTWIDGNTYTVSDNTAQQTLTNAVGCDSVVTLNLTVNYSNTGIDQQTACDSYTWIDGYTYTANNNTAQQTLTNVAGCDSVVTLNLTVNYSSTGDTTAVVCDYLLWWNTLYPNSTDKPTHVLTNAAGCDSTVTLHLTVHYSNTGIDEQTACDSYTWIDGNTYTASNNTAQQTLTNVVGCDSTVTLHLTVNYSSMGDTTATACDGFTWWNTNSTNSTNDATHTFTNAVGCDSVVTLNLTVNYSNTGIETVTACDSYTWIDGNTYTASNSTAQQTLTNVVGCDSVVTLNLTVNYNNTGVDQQTACDSYTWIDGETYTANNSTAQQTLTNSVGCDSVVTLNLTVNYSGTGDTSAVACDGFIWWNTDYTNSTDDATQVFTNVSGCDSTVTLHLTVNYSNTGVDQQTACDSFTWIDGNTYTASNSTAQQTLINAVGCDSTVTLNLTVNYSSTGDTSAVACDSFTWWNTDYTNSTNEATQVLTNAAGCDSTVTLHLTVNHSSTGDTTVVACDSFTWWNTDYTNSTDDATQVFTNAAGCDSTVTLHLTVNYSNTGDISATACDSFTWWNTVYTSSTSDAMHVFTNAAGCDSTVTLHLTVNYSSTDVDEQTACDSYTWIDGNTYTASNSTAQQTLTNVVGCDSVVTLNLTVNYSSTSVDEQTACDSYTWTDGNTYTASNSTAQQTLTNIAGCDSVTTLYLTVNYSAETTVTDTAEGTYTWHGTTYTESGTYQWQGTTEAGCDSIVTLLLVINNVGIEMIGENGVVVSVHPNPTNGWITIDAEDIMSVEVFDQTGRKITSYEQTNRINLGGLPTGGYMLKIHMQRGTSIQRVILNNN